MARRPRRLTPRQRLELLAKEMEPIIQAAFLEAIADIVSRVDLARVIERLERNDIPGALNALNIDPVAFRDFEEDIRRTRRNSIRQAWLGWFWRGGSWPVSASTTKGGSSEPPFSMRQTDAEKIEPA